MLVNYQKETIFLKITVDDEIVVKKNKYFIKS